MVVTISKYRIALPPIRPMVLTLPVLAIPLTRVPNSNCAMALDFVTQSCRKISPNRLIFTGRM